MSITIDTWDFHKAHCHVCARADAPKGYCVEGLQLWRKVDPNLPAPPKDLPRRGDAFRHWKTGAVYVVTGVSRSEHNPYEFNVHYLPEGASEDHEIPWKRTHEDFVAIVVTKGDLAVEPKTSPTPRFSNAGRRDIPSAARDQALSEAASLVDRLVEIQRRRPIAADDIAGVIQAITSRLGRAPFTPRPEVLAFARAMEEKLRRNDHKGGWKDESARSLLERAEDEIDELDLAVTCLRDDECGHHPSEAAKLENVLGEAADVANFVMMVADVCGALKS